MKYEVYITPLSWLLIPVISVTRIYWSPIQQMSKGWENPAKILHTGLLKLLSYSKCADWEACAVPGDNNLFFLFFVFVFYNGVKPSSPSKGWRGPHPCASVAVGWHKQVKDRTDRILAKEGKLFSTFDAFITFLHNICCSNWTNFPMWKRYRHF